jgi:hypothetical protein
MTTAVATFMARHRLTLPYRENWYIIHPMRQKVGQVNALNNLRGIPRITNGIMLYIEKASGEVVEVHRDWFVYDDPEIQDDHELKASKHERSAKVISRLLEHLLS